MCKLSDERNKSYSEQMEEQLEPRPTADVLDQANKAPKPWDHSDSHVNIHEHTQD